MFYRTNDKVVSISNIKEITFNIFGSGAKSNPYHYYITIKYFGDEEASLDFHTDKTLAEKTFEEIFKILTANA